MYLRGRFEKSKSSVYNEKKTLFTRGEGKDISACIM